MSPRGVFRRLETDDEFRHRLIAVTGGLPPEAAHGTSEQLDEWAWSARRVQRRIVEDCS